MSHAAEGSLQAYLDGELDSAAAADLARHVASCAACEAELDELRSLDGRAHIALALLDARPPVMRAQALIAARVDERKDRRRRLVSAGSFGFAKAAMLLIALAGAGAAVIPGSPLREAIQQAFARVFGTREPATVAPMEPSAPAPLMQVQNFGIAPVAGRIRISLTAPAGDVLVRIRPSDDTLADVETEQVNTVRFRSAPDRAELRDVADGTVTITIPRSVTNVTIDVDGVVYVTRRNGELVYMPRDAHPRLRFDIQN